MLTMKNIYQILAQHIANLLKNSIVVILNLLSGKFHQSFRQMNFLNLIVQKVLNSNW